MQKEIEVNGKKYLVRELLAEELDEIMESTDKKIILQKQVCISTGISNEEYKKLTVKERLSIIVTLNELNGLDEDFQNHLKIGQ